MKLGFVSAILPDLSLEEVAAFAAEAGFDCVELMCWPPGKAERRYAGVTQPQSWVNLTPGPSPTRRGEVGRERLLVP